MAYNNQPDWEIETCSRMLEIWAESGKDLYKLNEILDAIKYAHNHIFVREEAEEAIEALNAAEENPPICAGVEWRGGCDKPCDLKMIGNEKGDDWGETNMFARHPYHWNQCGDCFKKESGEE